MEIVNKQHVPCFLLLFYVEECFGGWLPSERETKEECLKNKYVCCSVYGEM